MSTTTTYRWRVLEITSDRDQAWKMKGKILGWRMTEESAKEHEKVNGRKLEKVAGSEETFEDYYGPQGYGGGPPGPPRGGSAPEDA